MVSSSGVLCYAHSRLKDTNHAKVVQQYVSSEEPPHLPAGAVQLEIPASAHVSEWPEAPASMKTDHLGTAEKLSAEWFKTSNRRSRVKLRAHRRHPHHGPALRLVGEGIHASQEAGLDSDEVESHQSLLAHHPCYGHQRSTFKEFYRWRRTGTTRTGPSSRTTRSTRMSFFFRQLLKYAREEEHIDSIPPIPKVGTIEANPDLGSHGKNGSICLKYQVQRVEAADGNPSASTAAR